VGPRISQSPLGPPSAAVSGIKSQEAAETGREHIPRIFPDKEVHVPAAFCGELQNATPSENPKRLGFIGEMLVGAVGIEPTTSPV
jgi:hypothetical protein